ncbi:hypothetical protein BJP25_17450 [Actinokineospora bangkokensis]|uniref:Glycosyltransferase subfamily 4-like N-terminal domain-containing protein n=2 Tax=Actinokineospora bangkokensis TaxID=1193682 RepID=A0A1Q9LML1_9PSEU|nr:glycosyltransferase [Actinokineospora bangkokensis]OLR93268.1 hypothetical protein BJP25_17450 [Actinokineospora bangkokensis]
MHCPGPAHHGVARHARHLARLLADEGVRIAASDPDVVHVQFSDSLYPGDASAAADAFTQWLADVPEPVVLTVHDLPGNDPDPARDSRRSAAYRRVLTSGVTVVVSARHEADKVEALTGERPHVIPLPLPRSAPPSPPPALFAEPSVGVAGFIYPGKGHEEAIRAAARQPTRPRVVALGSATRDHRDLVVKLHGLAGSLGVRFTVTGPLGEAEMSTALAAVTAPLVPARQVSASGSLMSWLAGSRRPLVAANEFSREVVERNPRAVHLYEADDRDALDHLLSRALRDGAHTRTASPPRWEDVGKRHVELYQSVVDGC